MYSPKNIMISRLMVCLMVIAVIGAVVSGKIWQDSESQYLIPTGDTINLVDQGEVRQLRLEDGRLVVYDGDNNLLNILDIDTSILPSAWQQQLADGGISFANEDALMSALDSLDEYDQ